MIDKEASMAKANGESNEAQNGDVDMDDEL
jgi:hypothetical protein